MPSLRDRAAAVLRANDRRAHRPANRQARYTVPSPRLYPHQWAWDSAFAAIGWAHLDLDRALHEVETLLGGAWPDGRVPHILFHDREGDYYPDASFWGTGGRWSSSITQPPAWAIALRRLFDLGADRGRIAALLAAVDRSHVFFHAQRDPLGVHAVAVVHPWESGRDNCPAWDPALADVDPNDAPPFRRVDTQHVADAAERPTDDQYRRYAAIVKGIADDDFGPGPFAVYDPFMTAILARAEADLAWVADRLGHETEAAARHRALAAGMEWLWDPARGRYAFHDVRTGARHTPDVLAAYAPLVTGAIDPTRAASLRDTLATRFATPWPLPTTAPTDAAYDPRRYWRGPTWVNTNWLFAPHLPALPLRERTLALVEREGFREYYHPETGEGLGAQQFAWTAALVLDWPG